MRAQFHQNLLGLILGDHSPNRALFLSGISGAGKSFLSKALRFGMSDEHVVSISTDDFWTDRDLNYNFDPTRLPEAHRWNFTRYLDLLPNEWKLIVVDNTNTSAVEIAPYYAAAEVHGYQPLVLRLHVPLMDAMKRSTHEVPLESLAGQWSRFKARDIPPWWNVVDVEWDPNTKKYWVRSDLIEQRRMERAPQVFRGGM